MFAFVENLTQMERSFFYIALAGTVFFALQSLFTFLDLGDAFESDGDYDADVDSELSFLGISVPFNLFSLRGIIAFIMMFGWMGFALSRTSLHPIFVFLLAFIAGFVMMVIIGGIYYAASRLKESGNVSLKSAIGKNGQVYLRIPEKQSGMGKVHIVLNGALKEFDALTEGEALQSGETVQVTDILNDKLLVKKTQK